MNREVLLANPFTASIIHRYDSILVDYKSPGEYDEKYGQYKTDYANWINLRKSNMQKAGVPPILPMGPKTYNRPYGIYHTMFRKITPVTCKGIVWYQGESNHVAGRSYQYRYLLRDMISLWRKDLEQPDLPFITVQLPTVGSARKSVIAELRDSQQDATQKSTNSWMAVIIDLGDYLTNHPWRKEEAGERIALLARAVVYKDSIATYTGPEYKAAKIAGNTIVISFDHIGSGLTVKAEKINDFVICDTSQNFVPAVATIKGNEIVVSSPNITNPVAVRYGWSNYFAPSLYNKENLPASPFRTDNFKLETQGLY
jgi:sialate O-acetylesterase